MKSEKLLSMKYGFSEHNIHPNNIYIKTILTTLVFYTLSHIYRFRQHLTTAYFAYLGFTCIV